MSINQQIKDYKLQEREGTIISLHFLPTTNRYLFPWSTIDPVVGRHGYKFIRPIYTGWGSVVEQHEVPLNVHVSQINIKKMHEEMSNAQIPRIISVHMP